VASDFDETDFVDSDFQAARKSTFASASSGAAQRPPSREELESRVNETQQRLQDLRRMQEELERERVALEEARRRRVECQTGREEMLQNLTRGIGLLEELELAARRDAEQLSRGLEALREALAKVQAIREDGWTQEDYSVELTRALTTLENARMEWNSAQLKWPVLSCGASGADGEVEPQPPKSWDQRGFLELCRLGLALTWPMALVLLGALGVLAAVLLRR
jgi:predicted RNase H-like nuclease (RuvC/YqgF family)